MNTDDIRAKLKLKKYSEENNFKKHKAAEGINLSKIRDHSTKLLGAGALTGTLLLSPPSNLHKLPTPKDLLLSSSSKTKIALSSSEKLNEVLKKSLPTVVRPLSREEEKYLEQIFEETLGIKTRATLEGEHLNQTYGLIGAEQHLLRYPGDSLAQHAPEENEYGGDNPQEILKEGIAPGKGAWGYFAPSKSVFTPQLEETERWYAVVQTLYLPDWNIRTAYLRDWYKYRKVLIVNTNNGKAVVAAIADSGPAAWTGKHFGGSPEVMDYLGGARYKKGPVVLFFVDDPENKVPLGPVDPNDTMKDIQLVA